MSLYPLNLDRLEWAARRELVMTMREACGIRAFASRMIGCSVQKLNFLLQKWNVESDEYGGTPFPEVTRTGKSNTGRPRKQVQRTRIESALNESKWNKRRAAHQLGIAPSTLYQRMAILKIHQEQL